MAKPDTGKEAVARVHCAEASRVVCSAPKDATTQPCPRCGQPMPALKGGTASICPNCGFKDSCCY